MNSSATATRSTNGVPATTNGQDQPFKTLFEQAPAAIAVLEGPEHTYTFANPLYQKAFGRTEAQLLGQTLRRVFPEVEGQGIYEIFHATYQSGKPYIAHQFPVRFTKAGEAKTGYYNFIIQPITNKGGAVASLIVHAHEVTEQVQAQKRLQEGEARYRMLFDSIDEGFCTIDVLFDESGKPFNYRFLEINKAFEQQTGLTDAVGRTMNDFARLEDFWYETYGAVAVTGTAVRFENRAENLHRYYNVYAFKVGSEHERKVAVLFTDITAQKTAELELKENKELLQTVYDSAPNSIAVMQTVYDERGKAEDFTILLLNAFTLNVTGNIDYKGKRYGDVFPTVKENGILDKFKEVANTGEAARFERWYAGEGMKHWFRFTAVKQGGLVVVTTEDITEQRMAEEALRKSEEFARTALENSPDCVKVLDAEGRLTYMNYNGTCLMEVDDFGSLENKVWWDLWPDDSKEEVRSAIAKAMTGETAQFQAFCPTAKGTPKWWDVMVSPVASIDGSVSQLISVSRDITEKRKTEEAVRQSEKQFKDITEAIPQLVWVCNKDGEVVYFNDKWYEFTGTGPEESLGHGWSRLLHPNDVPGTLEKWNEAQRNAAIVSVEYRLKTASGGYRWVFSRGIPITDSEGSIERWFGTCTDIHEQKMLAENLERLVAERTKELQRSNEDLQQFAHVASHDLKEPVRKIRTFGSKLKQEFGTALPEVAQLYLAKMESASARIYSMIDSVLLYSTLNALEGAAETVDLNGVLKSIETDLELPIEQKGVVVQYGPLPAVKGIPILLYQLFYNLLYNSIKFSKQGTQPRITITSSVQDAGQRGFVQLVIRDNGIGFNPSKAGEIFKVFTRLNARDQFEGTGLGLALCKKIVERHGGTIRAESVEGEGAAFMLTLPLVGGE